MQCHTIKIAQKLDIYKRFKNDRSNEIHHSAPHTMRQPHTFQTSSYGLHEYMLTETERRPYRDV